jgi:hypothetical protein
VFLWLDGNRVSLRESNSGVDTGALQSLNQTTPAITSINLESENKWKISLYFLAILLLSCLLLFIWTNEHLIYFTSWHISSYNTSSPLHFISMITWILAILLVLVTSFAVWLFWQLMHIFP